MISIGMIVNGAFSSASAADEYRLNEAGRATAPSRNALTSRRGLPVHVWVDETRPRNQGASLTAYELGAHGVNHTIIADNAGGLAEMARLALAKFKIAPSQLRE